MSPMSSTAGEDSQHAMMAHLWQPAAMFRSSPERSGDNHLAGAGMYTPSSTSSPPAHFHISGTHGHQLRLNTSSVQRSSSGHSVSSGISELLEPSSVSQARKDTLWQALVVSKSRADAEIDKIMRQWRETENGVIVCALDVDPKPGVGDDDAIILKVKRGHRRSISDIKRADGDKNEFRRRVIELAGVIRSSTVAELSNEKFTRGITEQLYGLLTEQRTRFPSDSNVSSLILDVLYQFSAVPQTVSQMAIPVNTHTSGLRATVSGDASPAASQFPSPLLAPDASLGRGALGHIQPLSSALSSQYEIASARNASHGHQLLASPASALGDFGDYRTARTVSGSPAQGAPHLQRCYQGSTSDSYLLSGPATRGMQPLGGSVPYVSSPRLVPGTAHSSTASLLSLLAPVHGGAGASGSIGRAGMAGGNVFGQTQSAAGLQQRQRSYIPSSVGTPHSSRLSIDTPDSEIELPARQSMDDANMRPPLRRHASKLSVSSDAADTYSFSYRPAARASLQQHQFYQQVSKQHPPAFPYHTAQQPTSQEPFSLTLSGRECEAAALVTPKRVVRPATMYISGSGGHASLRHFSESFLRQEKLASLLGQESDYSDSVPTSPAEPPARPFLDFDLFKRDTLKLPADALRTIPEARRGSDVDACSLLERQLDASTAAGDEVHALVVEGAAGTLQVLDGSDQVSNNNPLAVDGAAITVDSREANSAATVLGLESEAVLSAEDNMVVCRICDREFFRSELNAHSDVCILEQTRAMKLDEVNQRIKRLRDSISKRLLDIKKTRQWDRVAIRESERIIRIANRSIAWPEGDSQHEQIVAKAKFTKYIDKLETITGRSSSEPAPAPVNCCQIDDVTPQPAGVAATTLPRADVETIWLAMHLLVRVQEKFTIIEEFDKEFSRLEQQEALVREAESLNDDVSTEPVAPFLELPTWSQLAQTTRGSPAASERTSIDYMPSQSESGSATPDVSTPYSVGPGKGAITLTRRHSRHSRPDRRSLSRSARQGADIADGDSHSNGSGSRKLVSLFAALFRNNSVVGGFGRGKDAASSTSLLRRKNTPSPFASSALQPGAKAGSVLRRLSQNVPVAQAAKPLSAIPGAGSGHNTPSELIDGTCPATPASPADAPLASPVTRQRNNSQLASLRATPESAAKAPRMPSIDEFDFVKPISRGAFGRVYLARKKATKDLYAIKVMRKKDMIIKNMVTQALAERRALSLLSTEWVVQLYYAFHSSKHLFLVMEYLVGGDLAGLLRVRGVMQDDEAKFYIAEIGCAIDYLHRNSIVHRDIKPDNVILASDGHIKLTDFGLSQVAVRGNADTKPLLDGSETNSGPESPLSSDTARAGDSEGTERLVDKTDEYWSATLSMPGLGALATSSTANGAPATKALPQSKRAHARKSSRGFLGTPDYLAPELLLGAGNGLAVDWWALGVCLFEFMCGYPPFTDESPEAIFRNILNHAIDWPEEEGYVSEVAIELINSLLRPDPATRSHWKDIKSARLYEGWDLNNIRQMEPPLVPQPDDDVDTSYFESCQRSEIQRLSNATFLQIDNARRPPPPPPLLPATKKGDVATLPDPGSESQDDSQHGSQRGSQGGSYRGSRRGRVASGSASALCGPGAAVSEAGQLQKLFEAVSASSKCADDDHKPCTGEGIAADSQVLPRLTGSIATTSSSGNYSFTHDGGTSLSEHSEQFLGERLESRVAQTRPLSADGLAIANELGLDGEHNSINSLSEPEVEPAMLPGQGDIALVRPASRPETVSAARPVSAVVLSPVLPISFARRAISRSPSQHSDGILETATGHSGSTSKSHSRCASATVMLVATKKGTGTTKAKRPSHSNEYASESEYSAALVRSSSADERLQCAASGSGSALVLSPGGGGSVASSNAGNDCTDDNESEERDEDAERAFEDFTYKNLALLSHVNKGVSSSGHGTPTVERPPPGLPALSLAPAVAPVAIPSHRSSVYSSVSGNFRGSPINAYDIKQPTQSPDAC
ncbi:hypothetical protein EV174_000243 [Coemansia sp. RSA 2320]|nr:hypothetical protein EV174_000243 [Coemansia sp. RSA 2320]